MIDENDNDLLHRYSANASEEDFASLVNRHINLVYSSAIRQMRKLGETYPPALEALTDRRDAAEARIVDGKSDMLAMHELIRLNENLGEPEQSMALFDRLPSGHSGRAYLVDLAAEQFVNAGRYEELVQIGNPEATFDREHQSMNMASSSIAGNELLEATLRRRVVNSGGRGVEALAGADQIERAMALADKVLAVDESPETRAQLLKYAKRAGNAEVIAYVRGD